MAGSFVLFTMALLMLHAGEPDPLAVAHQGPDAASAAIASATRRLPAEQRAGVADALRRSGSNRAALIRVLQHVPQAQRPGAAFLIAHMPQRDLHTLSSEFLVEHITQAYEARAAAPWRAALSEALFLNYVLPYANVNERRDGWRKDFRARFGPVVRDCATPSEAAMRLNRAVFEITGVRYHPTRRPKPDQSPYESISAGYASCTGLSILLIDACRAVGVPARFVGTPSWTSETGNTHPGNHSWVEIWDGQWHFLGASEQTALDHTWFFRNASRPEMETAGHRIYAASFERTETAFPLVWNAATDDVSAHDVTSFYTARRQVTFEVFDRRGGQAVPAMITARHEGTTVARGPAGQDRTYALAGGQRYALHIEPDDGRPPIDATVQVPFDPDPTVAVHLNED